MGLELIDRAPNTLSDALIRIAEPEDTLRSIGAVEIDAVVVAADGAPFIWSQGAEAQTGEIDVKTYA